MNQIIYRSSHFTVGATITVELQLHLIESVRFRLIVRRDRDPFGIVLVPDRCYGRADPRSFEPAPPDTAIDGDYVLASPRSGSPLWVRYRNSDIKSGEPVRTEILYEPWSVIDRIADLTNR